MKTLLFSPFVLITLLLLSINVDKAYAQLIENADFEATTCPPDDSFFAYECMDLPNPGAWIAVSGAPRRVVDGACESATAFFVAGQELENGSLVQFGSSLAYSFPENLPLGDYTLTFRHDAVFDGGPFVDLRVDLASGIPALDFVPFNQTPDYEDQNGQKPLDINTAITVVQGVAAVDDACDVFSFDFTISTGQVFNQLWFYGITENETTGQSRLFLDDVRLTRCSEQVECNEDVNLNACTENGSTGYIQLSCGAGSSYDFSLPNQSTANVSISDDMILITNAGIGEYVITVTNAEGCSETRSFTVVEKCCTDQSCQIPSDLGCINLFGETYLKWSAVPNVTQYQVCLFPGRCGTLEEQIVFCSEGNRFNIDEINIESFEWTVKAICPDGSLSAASPTVCFDGRRCSGFSDGGFALANPCPDFNCTENLNLVYCPEENTTGYIELSCGSELEYNVTLPFNNSAEVSYGEDNVTITNAKAGVYTIRVVVPNSGGCTTEYEYEVVEICCNDTECPTPQNLGCTNRFGETFLRWTAVTDAVAYEICVFSGDCGACNLPTVFTTTTNQLNINLIDAESFEWTVKAICPNGAPSNALPRVCFDPSRCNGFGDGFNFSRVDEKGTDQLMIYPNPNNGIFEIKLSNYNPSDTQTHLKIFNQLGTVVFQKQVTAPKLSLDLSEMSWGIYTAMLTTKNESLIKRFVIR